MSEAELLETAQAVWGNYISCIGILISIISGYLVVAYIVGRTLTRSQVLLVNVTFFVFTSFAILSMFEFSQTGTELMTLALAQSAQRSEIGITIVPQLTVIVFPLLVLGSYKFMWDVRHPRAD
jgi:hypothetical protein